MMRSPVIDPIVEGLGDMKAAPLLLRRVLGELHGRYDVRIQRPVNAKGKSNLINKLERLLTLAQYSPECDGILVLLDGDEDCPRALATELVERAYGMNMDLPTVIVCANSAYEAWFVASLDSATGSQIKARLGLSEATNF
jgi:hypothetical protein